MNHYIFIRRLTGPAILLLLGFVWLLHQAHLVRFAIFIPLLLILLGVLKLAERAALASDPSFAASYGDMAQPFPGGPVPPPPGSAQMNPTILPPQESGGRDADGGKL